MSLRVAPGTARSIFGVALLVVGSVTLIALLLPGEGILNRYVFGLLRPAFGQGAWLLPVLLLVAGVLVERGSTVDHGWGVTALGGFLLFLATLGLIHLVAGSDGAPAALREGGGWVGFQLSRVLSALVSPAGALVILLGALLAGALLLFDLTVATLVGSVAAVARTVTSALTAVAPVPEAGGLTAPGRGTGRAGRGEHGDARGSDARGRDGRGRDEEERATPPAAHDVPGGPGDEEAGLPPPLPSPAPLSQTVWSGAREEAGPTPPGVEPGIAGEAAEGSRETGGEGAADASVETALRVLEDVAPAEGVPWLVRAGDSPVPIDAGGWRLPALGLLDEPRGSADGRHLDHERNIRIIEEKLRSFQIPASVTATNTGPVVTQYEVRPDARVKLSRIEGLADDLAMALAARTIRIEAPIPGRDVVGIEIPNHASEVVSFRALFEDARMAEATSRLTFALGRDVSGKAYAVDLAKMPHLLIAGATGSGKSVCLNALITSLLMRARPDEVRLVLVDLKRVELAAYDGLPHLLTNVIIEAGDAKAALEWAVGQMEERYRALADRAERNIAAYNASSRVEPRERLPYIVIVIDELADLIMREGRKIEDPIVKIAQKARAVGIHLVLATQRPSVNVVTGLIKANVPSRIAFAMASNVDSRTVLDQPGAEDLIGRGDMLYQPADLPRPIRLQGVFVSDAEVRTVSEHWRRQAPTARYDPAITAYGDGQSDGGQFAWLGGMAEDDMTARAAELVLTSGRASTSMLQTKLKVGFNRASRLIEELERYGIVGPQDPRNPAVPRQVYGPENWLRGPRDVDEP